MGLVQFFFQLLHFFIKCRQKQKIFTVFEFLLCFRNILSNSDSSKELPFRRKDYACSQKGSRILFYFGGNVVFNLCQEYKGFIYKIR